MDKAIHKAREIFKAYGFEVVERIALKNIRTGKSTDKEEWIMTNYEAIKAMGMNELAGFLASLTTCCNCPVYRNCDGHVVCTAALLE